MVFEVLATSGAYVDHAFIYRIYKEGRQKVPNFVTLEDEKYWFGLEQRFYLFDEYNDTPMTDTDEYDSFKSIVQFQNPDEKQFIYACHPRCHFRYKVNTKVLYPAVSSELYFVFDNEEDAFYYIMLFCHIN
jgi:hypothetical protein